MIKKSISHIPEALDYYSSTLFYRAVMFWFPQTLCYQRDLSLLVFESEKKKGIITNTSCRVWKVISQLVGEIKSSISRNRRVHGGKTLQSVVCLLLESPVIFSPGLN